MILITGGSGQLSKLICGKARAAGLDFVVGSHHAAPQYPDRRRIDFDDPTTLNFAGVETVLLVSAGYGEDDVVMRRHDAVITAAERFGVRHLVYTSLCGAGDHLAFALAHRWTERRLRESTLDWTILRNGLYAELVGALATPVDGCLRAPFGDGPLPCIAREDLAEIAVAVLSEPAAHRNLVHELSGRAEWSMRDLAGALGVDYRPSTLAEARLQLSTLPLLPFQPAMLMSIYSVFGSGLLVGGPDHSTRLLVTQPRNTLAIAAAAATAVRSV